MSAATRRPRVLLLIEPSSGLGLALCTSAHRVVCAARAAEQRLRSHAAPSPPQRLVRGSRAPKRERPLIRFGGALEKLGVLGGERTLNVYGVSLHGLISATVRLVQRALRSV